MSHHLLCRANAPTETVILSSAHKPQPEEGQVLVHVAKLVVTANTVTYAIAGRMPKLFYFDHFPPPKDAPEDVGMCPVWGTGVVVASRCAGLPTGTRIHGYFTFSEFVCLTPGEFSNTQFVDVATHRAHLLKPYNTYFTHADPMYAGLSYDEEDFQLAVMTLFSTGWAMAQVAAVHPEKPQALILTSASSRTARAAAFAAKFHALPLEVIGLTSASNREYTASFGVYDRVLSYDEVAQIPKQKVAIQDVAGSGSLRQSLYKHLGEDIVYFGLVGMSHSGSAGALDGSPAALRGLGGAAPASFLVFDAIKEVSKVHGGKKVGSMVREATVAFKAQEWPHFKPQRCYGPEAVQAVFANYVSNKADPKLTYVCSMWPEAAHDPAAASSKL